MTSDDDPLALTEAERFQEIASILATAVVRLHERHALLPADENASSSEDSLAAGDDPRLSVRVE